MRLLHVLVSGAGVSMCSAGRRGCGRAEDKKLAETIGNVPGQHCGKKVMDMSCGYGDEGLLPLLAASERGSIEHTMHAVCGRWGIETCSTKPPLTVRPCA